MEFEAIIKIAAAITALVAAFFALRKLYQWAFPIKIKPSYSVWFNSGETPDSIRATITNKGSEVQYIVKCEARGTFSVWHILKQHVFHPLVKPSLYPNIWYNGAVYNLLKIDSVKIEQYQQIELFCELYEHPLNAMYTPYFLVTVTLSTGKKIRKIEGQVLQSCIRVDRLCLWLDQ